MVVSDFRAASPLLSSQNPHLGIGVHLLLRLCLRVLSGLQVRLSRQGAVLHKREENENGISRVSLHDRSGCFRIILIKEERLRSYRGNSTLISLTKTTSN